MTFPRSALAVVVGVLVGGLVIGAIQLVGMLLFPLPGNMTAAQFEALDWEAKRDLLHGAPSVVFVPVLLGYLVGPLAGGWAATRLTPGRHLWAAIALGFFFTLVNLVNVWMIPQPMWVTIVSFLLFLPSAVAGGLLAGGEWRRIKTSESKGNGAANETELS